jgi:hypothetical protein
MESDTVLEETALERGMKQVEVDAIGRREPLEVGSVQYQETRTAGIGSEMQMQPSDASKAPRTLQPTIALRNEHIAEINELHKPPEGLTVSAPLPAPIPIHVLTSLSQLQQLYTDLPAVEPASGFFRYAQMSPVGKKEDLHIELSLPDSLAAERVLYLVGW